MTRSKTGEIGAAIGLVLFFAGCADAPPPPPKPVEPPPKPAATVTETATATAEPEPVGDGTEASPFRLNAGEARALPIEVKTRQVVGFVAEESADVVLSWSGGRLHVTDPGGVDTGCAKSPCVLPLAMKGAYRATVRDGEPGAKLAVSASALAPPKPLAIKPGRPFVLKTKAIAADDPRGAIADAAMHFDAPGLQVLDLRPLGGKRTAQFEELVRRVKVEVYGPAGTPVSTMSASPDVGGALQLAFDAAAADYVLRVVKDGDQRADAVEVTLHKPSPVRNPAAGEAPPIPASAASLPKLKIGGKVDFEVSPEPEPPVVWVNVPEGMDLAVTWKSAAGPVSLGARRKDESRLCDSSPCLFARPKPGPLALFAYPTDAQSSITAEARALPLPAVAATLAPGGSAEITTVASEDDPRGAMAEIAVDLDAAGNFDVAATIVDFKAPADIAAAAKDLPRLEIFTPEGTPALGPMGLVSSADLQSGTGRASVTAQAAGRYLVRIDGEGKAAARKLKITCEKSRW